MGGSQSLPKQCNENYIFVVYHWDIFYILHVYESYSYFMAGKIPSYNNIACTFIKSNKLLNKGEFHKSVTTKGENDELKQTVMKLSEVAWNHNLL